jgi:rubrerythrin
MNGGLGKTLAAVASAVGVALLAIGAVFAGVALIDKIVRPTHPCPACGKPISQGDTPCPFCKTELAWEKRS